MQGSVERGVEKCVWVLGKCGDSCRRVYWDVGESTR